MKKIKTLIKKLIKESLRDLEKVEEFRRKMIEFYEKESELNTGINTSVAVEAKKEAEKFRKMSVEEVVSEMDSNDRLYQAFQEINDIQNNVEMVDDRFLGEYILKTFNQLSIIWGIKRVNSFVKRNYGDSQLSNHATIENRQGEVLGKVPLPVGYTEEDLLESILMTLKDFDAFEIILSKMTLPSLMVSLNIAYDGLDSVEFWDIEDIVASSVRNTGQHDINNVYEQLVKAGFEEAASEIKQYYEPSFLKIVK